MTQPGRHFAIIGAGFSGSLLAVHLLRRSNPDDRILLFERAEEFGRGLAYAADNPGHLLNVRASNMSAFSDQPDHFLQWLATASGPGTGTAGDSGPMTFASRQLYGSYIRHVLASELRSGTKRHRLTLVSDEAVALRPVFGGYSIETREAGRYDVDAAILAVGNFPAHTDIEGYAASPWAGDALNGLDRDAAVLLIGTGLTMVDVVLSLLDRGHRGPIHAISRRGLLPHTHAPAAPAPRFLAQQDAPRSVRGLLSAIRREVRRASAQGGDWRSVVDSLRPDTQSLWRSLPLEEKRRFLRHLRPWWDIHRHRMAPAISARLQSCIASGQLTVRRARLRQMHAVPDGIEVTLQPVFGTSPLTIPVARIVNCTGLTNDFSRVELPLIRSLLASGLARTDPLELGLDVTGDGDLIGASGEAAHRLFAVGPVTKGVFWESTAVPDIRVQCENLAAHILGKVRRSHRIAGSTPYWDSYPGIFALTA